MSSMPLFCIWITLAQPRRPLLYVKAIICSDQCLWSSGADGRDPQTANQNDQYSCECDPGQDTVFVKPGRGPAFTHVDLQPFT